MRKVIRHRIAVGLAAVVIVAVAVLTPVSVSASYVSDHINDAKALEEMWELYTAASHCLGSPGRESIGLRLSGTRSDSSTQAVKNFYNLNSGSIFGGTSNPNKIYSATLEKVYKGYDDGKLYCSEANYIVDLLNALGKYDTDTRNKLICDGSNPGLFSIESGYGPRLTVQDDDKRPEGWPAFTGDCSGNLAKLIEYAEQRPSESIAAWNGYEFTIRLEPSANAASHFQKVVGPLVGRFDEPDGDTRKMMQMWRYTNAFQAGCAQINNGNTTPPAASTTNMIGIYDMDTGQTYYHARSDINSTRQIYYNVSDSATLTCETLAGKINDLAGVAQEIAKDAQKADCEEQKKAFLQTQLNAASAQYNHATDAEAKQKAKDYIDKYTNWQFWEENADGEIVCREIEGFSGTENSPETRPTPPPSSGSDNSNSGIDHSSDVDECFGAAGSLGWILCPVLRAVSEGVDDIYEGYIQQQFLEVNYENFKEGSPVHTGWKAIRDFANIAFVIFFLIVLFSQLTGIGLSNYGIKKILPRLVMVVVLVNISFLLCQFAVDVSNVLGYSLNSIFSQMSASTGLTQATVTSFNSAAGSNSSVAGWVGVLGIAIGAGTIGSWLIPLLLTLLSCAISVFFGAIILGARQAGVLILAVLAPAAIVCYALPNAKNLFDRWLKMFTTLLMVFPICGALMGGGFFASNIILATPGANFFVILVGMLLRVVPFFLIPGLIRSSFTAMGNIGNKIANVGNKIGRTTTGAAARSDFVKRRDADLARLQGGATALRGRALSKITGKPMSDRRKAKIARQYAKYNRLKSEEAGANPYAMSPGSREYEALKNAAHQNRIDTMAKNIALENTGIATDETALAERHAEALAALNEDQSDENLAAVQAYQDMLITSDGGRTKMFDNYAQATVNGQDKGIELGAQHLLRNHTKDIKPNNRDFFSYLGEASRISSGGDVQSSSFRQFTDNKGNSHYLSSHFANQGISSYDAASIAKMDEGSLDRLIEQAETGGLEADQKRVLEQYTRQAMTSDNIHVQDKIATKFNTLRSKMGYQTIDTNTRSANATDSGRIQLHDGGAGAGNNAGNAGVQGGGPILRTGNDDRAGNSGPLPTPLREGNNYRQNDSGIWLPPNQGGSA